MRIFRTPAIARRLFTGNQLYGWEGEVKYDCLPRKDRKRKKPKPVEVEQEYVPVKVFTGGVEAQQVV